MIIVYLILGSMNKLLEAAINKSELSIFDSEVFLFKFKLRYFSNMFNELPQLYIPLKKWLFYNVVFDFLNFE